jgi:hypothetical protein
MSGLSIATKRACIFILAAAFVILSFISLLDCHSDAFCIITNALIMAGAIFGVLGTYRMDMKYLTWFLITLAGLIILQSAYIIVALSNGIKFRHLITNAILLGILILGAGFTADLRNSHGAYDTIGEREPILHPSAV